MGGGERAQKKEGPAKGRDRTESHNKEYKKGRAQKRESMSMRDKDTRNTAGRKGPEKGRAQRKEGLRERVLTKRK